MALVVTLIQDMLFSSKVREAAKALGAEVKSTRDPAAFGLAAAAAAVAIVDLRLPAALDALRAVPADSKVVTVGFVEHERVEVMDAARAAGCTHVMAKGQFATALPKLIAAHAGPGHAGLGRAGLGAP